MEFSFSTANTIHFGNGISRSLSSFLPSGTDKAFVVTGSSRERQKAVFDLLEKNGVELEFYAIEREPTIDDMIEAVNAARRFAPKIVIGIGGGSVLDSGKVVAALLQNQGELMDYLEVVGKGRSLQYPSLPYMAIPTTAGTGSEVTANSVLSVPDARVKVSLRSPYMLPHWAVVDPELTYELPQSIAAYTSMDAFIQCLEAYLSKNASPITDGIALEGITRAARSIRKACRGLLDRDSKSDMCVASLCSGIALANAKLGAIHGFAGPIGGMIDAPHGALCASLLLPVVRTNFEIMARREPEGSLARKFDSVARAVTLNPVAKGNYAIAWIESLVNDLPLASLKELGFSKEQIPEAVEKAARSSSMKGNPIELERADLREILEDSLSAH